MEKEWKSSRAIKEDEKLYIRRRFEYYMELVDIGMLETAVALSALREELAQATDYEDDAPTIALDTNEIKRMLEEEE